MGPLRAAGEAWKGGLQGRTSPYPFLGQCPPPPGWQRYILLLTPHHIHSPPSNIALFITEAKFSQSQLQTFLVAGAWSHCTGDTDHHDSNGHSAQTFDESNLYLIITAHYAAIIMSLAPRGRLSSVRHNPTPHVYGLTNTHSRGSRRPIHSQCIPLTPRAYDVIVWAHCTTPHSAITW